MKRFPQHRGLTLLELLAAAVVLGIAFSLSAAGLWRSDEEATITRAIGQIEAAVLRAQSMALRGEAALLRFDEALLPSGAAVRCEDLAGEPIAALHFGRRGVCRDCVLTIAAGARRRTLVLDGLSGSLIAVRGDTP